MAKIYFVRHAKAGERRLWTGDDRERPLSPKGWKQSELLADRFVKLGVSTLHSSPYLRCVQTLEPLAGRLQRSIEIEPRLTEEEPFEPVLGLIAEVPDGAVLCSHGDVIPMLLEYFASRGVDLGPDPACPKGSTWVLDFDAAGEVHRATYWPPPDDRHD